MQTDESWKVPHNEDHQFFLHALERNHWVLQRWIKYFKERDVLFDLVECPVGEWQIYKHKRISTTDSWRPCCLEGEEEI